MSKTSKDRTVRLRVSPQVARIVSKEASRDEQLMAARGVLPLPGKDLVAALFFFYHGADPEVKAQALETLKGLSSSTLASVVQSADTHPQLLDFVARVRMGDVAVMEPLLSNPSVASATLIYVASNCEAAVLSLVAQNGKRLKDSPGIIEAILANPRVDGEIKARLGYQKESVPCSWETELAVSESGGESEAKAGTDEAIGPAVEDPNLSKYQQALEIGISEKIKIALAGDKEWRSILLKDANKLVSSAVLKNPRITEGEVLAVARDRNSNEELIRLITLNREWVKNYEIRKALVIHPRTPLPKALRYMSILAEKDLKGLTKSRSVSQIIVSNARRMLSKEKKR
jgi:hypothetical protein